MANAPIAKDSAGCEPEGRSVGEGVETENELRDHLHALRGERDRLQVQRDDALTELTETRRRLTAVTAEREAAEARLADLQGYLTHKAEEWKARARIIRNDDMEATLNLVADELTDGISVLVRPYVQHKPDCAALNPATFDVKRSLKSPPPYVEGKPCDCGLSTLLKGPQ